MAGLRIRAVGLSEIAAHPYLSLDPNDYLDEGDEVEAGTATKFDPEAGVRAAFEAVDRRVAERLAQVNEEAETARAVAKAYAQHLDAGGHPWQTPEGVKTAWRGRDVIVSDLTGIVAVYREWNLARGSMNPILPFQDLTKWKLAERLLESVGEPVLYADLSQIGTSGYSSRSRTSSDEVQRAMRQVEEGLEGALVGRKTKVDGKVAYFLRPRRDEDGEYDGRPRGDMPEEAPDGR